MSVNLYAYGGLGRAGLHLGDGFVSVAYEAVGGDEFRIHHVRPVLFADDAERCVGHVFHRRQKHRPVSQINIPDKHKQIQK